MAGVKRTVKSAAIKTVKKEVTKTNKAEPSEVKLGDTPTEKTIKECNKCKEIKSLDSFYNRKDSKDGKRNDCKECASINNKSYRLIPINSEKERIRSKIRFSQKIHNVYLLPNENYVGTTKNILTRMSHHRGAGKNTDNFRILYSTEVRSDALEMEELLHNIGYYGKHKNNMYK